MRYIMFLECMVSVQHRASKFPKTRIIVLLRFWHETFYNLLAAYFSSKKKNIIIFGTYTQQANPIHTWCWLNYSLESFTKPKHLLKSKLLNLVFLYINIIFLLVYKAPSNNNIVYLNPNLPIASQVFYHRAYQLILCL